MTDKIAVINPNTGVVVYIIDFHPLRKRIKINSYSETCNGFALNEEADSY